MPLSNDDRGWVMTGLSGLACILGAAFICIDIVVRQFPGQRNFRIQDSDVFLSVSLSLSFGVMLFSALFNMLPSSKQSLEAGGFSAKEASWILIACFLGGVVGIQFLSRVMHHFIPSHVVDCEHTHEDDEEAHKEGGRPHHNHPRDHGHGHSHGHSHSHSHSHSGHRTRRKTTPRKSSLLGTVPSTYRRSSSYRSTNYFDRPTGSTLAPTLESETQNPPSSIPVEERTSRPPLHVRITTGISQLAGGQKACDSNGPCYGYSELCGQDCFKIVNARGGLKVGGVPGTNRPANTRSVTISESTPLLHQVPEEPLARPRTQAAAEGAANARLEQDLPDFGPSDDSSTTVAVSGSGRKHLHKTHSHSSSSTVSSSSSSSSPAEDDEHPEHHHHHVPANAFLSIGLQTSIAIALHKLPEGFITYATNHANPKLGVSVFLALFIHNITEGFALALPLYLAINSRWKAMVVSFVLGGLSQPLGAGVAALWFRLAGRTHYAPSEGVYGGMFAVTAGIMASVALQLFSESLDLTHSKQLCMIGAFSGMAILGISGALTA